MAASTIKPSTFGIWASSTTTSGTAPSSASSASAPSRHIVTSAPRIPCRKKRTTRAVSGLSSA